MQSKKALQYALDQNNTMIIDKRLALILEKIDFINRYKKLSDEFRDEANFFENYKVDIVKDIFESLGYHVSYNKSERFFKIKEKVTNQFLKILF